MPRMDDDNANPSDSLAKLLLIGDGKVGKTHYAAAGFNVLYFDGDVGRPTLRQLPNEARKRIFALDCADTLNGGIKDSRFCDTLVEFTNSSVFRWNDSQSRLATRKDTQDEIWEIRPAKMDHTCVLVLDSWTGLSESMLTKAATNHSISLTDASTPEMRPVYQSAGLLSQAFLQVIRSMRCHVIVLAHPDEYTKTKKPDGRTVGSAKENDHIIEWTKLVPKSTSKPQGLSMAKYFTDIAWAETNATGSQRLINAKISDGRISGGHWNERKDMEEYSFANLVKQLGGQLPGPAGAPMDHWFKIIEPGESAPVAPTVLDGAAPPAQVKAPGAASLFGKKPVAAG
jgi:hypothetical protein